MTRPASASLPCASSSTALRTLRFGTAFVVVVLAYLCPYFCLGTTWWRFIGSTVLILGTGWLACGAGAWRLFGLQTTRQELTRSALVFLAALPVSFVLASDGVIGGPLRAEIVMAPSWMLAQFFQVLNDEIVSRAVLLTLVLRVFPHPKTAIVAQALLFAFGHRLVYGHDGFDLAAPVLLTLFAFNVALNTLFVRFGHIGYGVALHYAWNAWRFNYRYYVDGLLLSEGATFNYVEGSRWVVAAAILLFVVAWSAYLRSGSPSSLAVDA